jgi:uncharacterized protein (TIGR02246 family)
MRTHLNWSRALFAVAALSAAAAGGFLAVRTPGTAAGDEQIRNAPSRSDPENSADEKAILKMQSAYIAAFNAGDAKALASFWTLDGEFADADGHTFRGRGAIEKEFASFFAESKGLTLEVATDSIRFVSPGVALETGSSRVKHAADGGSSSTSYNIVLTKKDGQWQLASVRETPFTPSSNYDRLRDIEWLVGNWTAKGANQALDLSCEWTAKRNFLTRRYSVAAADGTTKTGLQIIGWDPLAGGIRAWIFDSDGGFGSERWTKDGQRWIIEASGVTRDGVPFAATNVITPVDKDSFTWQSIRRTVNEVRLPDTALITATRVKTKK